MLTLITLPLNLQRASMLLVVSMHTHIWFTTYHSCICHARVHVTETHEMCGKTCAYANQYARVRCMQTKDANILLM